MSKVIHKSNISTTKANTEGTLVPLEGGLMATCGHCSAKLQETKWQLYENTFDDAMYCLEYDIEIYKCDSCGLTTLSRRFVKKTKWRN